MTALIFPIQILGSAVSSISQRRPLAPLLRSARPYTIEWDATGTIPNVDVVYDINDGNGANGIPGDADDYPYTIATDVVSCTPVAPATTCSSSYNWPSVPDRPTALARIKVIDSRAEESDVVGISEHFNIVGNLTLVAPDGNEDWRVNTTHNITWTWGGTIAVVKLYYAVDGDQGTPTWVEIDPGVTKDYSGDGLQQDGANNTIQRNLCLVYS